MKIENTGGEGQAALKNLNNTRNLLSEIREYGGKFPVLKESHHFLFDLPLGNRPRDYSKCVVLMGINPGETKQAWQITNGETSEETSEFDFHGKERSSSSKRWMGAVDYFIPDCFIAMTELFFWSTPNTNILKNRIGTLNAKNKHLVFCKEINRRLISIHEPKLIIFTGLSFIKVTADLYGLKPITTTKNSKNHRLTVTMHDGERYWLFSKHWTGSRGFSNQERAHVKGEIAKRL